MIVYRSGLTAAILLLMANGSPVLAGERSTALDPIPPLANNNVAEIPDMTGFPEETARAYILAAGYSGVKDLTPINNLVWRATAFKDGTTFDVAVDYSGAVVGAN